MNTFHTATDRRCYNGAYCADLQKEINSIATLVRKAAALGARCTFFPMEGKYSVWDANNKQVSKMHFSKGEALVEFLNARERTVADTRRTESSAMRKAYA